MSLVWTLIDVFLLMEILVITLLILPIFGVTSWSRLFKSKFLAAFTKRTEAYIYIIVAILLLFLLEAMKDLSRFTNEQLDDEAPLDLKIHHNMRLFRAQRNLYITGFTIFLVLIIKRLVVLITKQATLMEKSEANLKHAKSVSIAVSNIISNNEEEKIKEKLEETNINEVSVNNSALSC